MVNICGPWSGGLLRSYVCFLTTGAVWVASAAVQAQGVPEQANPVPSLGEDALEAIGDPSPRAAPVLEPMIPEIEAEPQLDLEALAESDAPAASDAPTLCVRDFEVVGSTVFSNLQLAQLVRKTLAQIDAPACLQGQQLTFPQMLQVRSAVTDLYLQQGYLTSGAIIPADTPFENGVVVIQVVEGGLEDIRVQGTRRLRPSYIQSRLGLAAAAPLNRQDLLTGLQLLQLDPLIETVRADLQAGVRPGRNLLVVEVAEADSFEISVFANNNRSPSVGSLRRGITVQEGNLLGVGDALSLSYVNTGGSDEFRGSYILPVSPRGTTLEAAVNVSDSDVIEDPFEVLEIASEANTYRLTLQHPLVNTPRHRTDIGLSLFRQYGQTELGLDDIGPFPLSAGADDQGRTVVSALRFFQTWTRRDTQQVVALRSQFSLGLGGFLNGTVNDNEPDSRFFAWQGQAQWVRRLGRDALFLLRGTAQLTGGDLLSVERLGAGGQATVRGYRQEELLTDSGLQLSAEARFPVLRSAAASGVLQVAPFVDFAHGWNAGGSSPDANTLVGAGLGLIWQQPNLGARLDWGVPLVDNFDSGDSLQENGLYFSINYSL